MSGTPERIILHRELEYLRAAGSIPKGKKGKKAREARARVKVRYKKLREVDWKNDNA